ncbi:MAG: hypothetical protein WBB74_08595 [Gaiellaceae bacterium]
MEIVRGVVVVALLLLAVGGVATPDAGACLPPLAAGLAFDPSWSPDGRRVALTWINAHHRASVDIWDVQKRKLSFVAAGSQPSWAPDGKRLVYVNAVPLPPPSPPDFVCGGWTQDDLFVKPLKANSSQLTFTRSRRESAPVWSPQGDRIAFAFVADSDPAGAAISIGIATLDLKTGAEKVLASSPWDNATGNGMLYSDPAWSPDGQRLAFVIGTVNSTAPFSGDIAVIDTDGSGFHIVLHLPNSFLSHPAWSPGGDKLAFNASSRNYYDSGLFVSDAEGTHPRRLTRGNDREPAWSPDGRTLVFVRAPLWTRRFRSVLYTIPADGSGRGRPLFGR